MVSIFDPIKVGSIDASNRVFMAPLTRARGTKEATATPIMVEYYAQRVGAGLIISEAIGISRRGLGWPYATGLWNEDQVKSWKFVTDAVHARGGKIVAQLWHMGRMAHSHVTGDIPVSASATAYPGPIHTYKNDGKGKEPGEVAHALTKEEIKEVIADYAAAARNAIAAGFDGVQIHSANGYLIDEFLKSSTNERTDEYGGSPENRARFMREVVSAVIAAIGADRTSIRLSPTGNTFACFEPNPEEVFVPAAKFLSDVGIAFLELREPPANGTFGKTDQPKIHGAIRPVFKGPLILNQDYTRDEALLLVTSGECDGVAFGRPFISNPDLVYKLKQNLPLGKDNMKTWYTHSTEGYTDYPVIHKL